MFTKETFDAALNAAAALDGTKIVKGGGMAAVSVARCIGVDFWVAKADWSNLESVFVHEDTPERALKSLTTELLAMVEWTDGRA